jgi:hypothetical protein
MLRISLQRFATNDIIYQSIKINISPRESGVVASPLAEEERMKVRGWICPAVALVALTPADHPIRWVGDPQACVDVEVLTVSSDFVSAVLI